MFCEEGDFAKDIRKYLFLRSVGGVIKVFRKIICHGISFITCPYTYLIQDRKYFFIDLKLLATDFLKLISIP